MSLHIAQIHCAHLKKATEPSGERHSSETGDPREGRGVPAKPGQKWPFPEGRSLVPTSVPQERLTGQRYELHDLFELLKLGVFVHEK
jgi:hypothetical protein